MTGGGRAALPRPARPAGARARVWPGLALIGAALAAACRPEPVTPAPARVATAAEAPVCGDPATLGPAFDEPLPREGFDARRADAAIRHFTNAERCARGLAPLEEDRALREVSTRHAANMARLGFFSHDAPPEAGGRLRARAVAAGANPPLLGENIAAFPYHDFQGRPFYTEGDCDFAFSPGGPSIPPLTYRGLGREAVAEWMSSPSHREGLLDPRYARMGAGAALAPEEGECGMVYAGQVFAGG